MKRGVWFLVSIFFVPIFFVFVIDHVQAQRIGHMTLLAVSEATQLGSAADVYLTIQNGHGGVYIETAPLTKIDTQLSTRFAQQIACDFIDEECIDTDFFYTIRSDASIIGGPSAGAAIAVITVAMLDNRDINESVAITGTINVGGLIGAVSGITGKIAAAHKAGVTKVLIPKGTRYEIKPEHSYNELLINTSAPFFVGNNETNMTEIDTFMYGEALGIEVKEVATLQEALYEITEHWYEADESKIRPPYWYTKTMQDISTDLCRRNRLLAMEVNNINYSNNSLIDLSNEQIINTTRKAENATAYDMNYVAASTCFGSNIILQYGLLKNAVPNATMINALNISIEELQTVINTKDLETITDLQTYLVVNERLSEAREKIRDLQIAMQMNDTDDLAYKFAYAMERVYSASLWAHFFNNDGNELKLDAVALKESCQQKLAEAQERYQYVKINTAEQLDQISTYLSIAYAAAAGENYLVCLDMASRAKANVDIIISLIGVKSEEELIGLVEDRLKLVRQVINKQKEKGYFPMLGYSYYEYAEFLKNEQPYSALIYSHYALEFSRLDMYFKEKKDKWYLVIDAVNILYFISGFVVGIVICNLPIKIKK